MPTNPKKLLLVGGSATDAGRIRRAVGGGDYVLATAASAAEGLEALAARDHSLILLDLSIAEAGLGPLVEIRAQSPGVPVLVLGAADDDGLAAQAVRAGAQDYLVKTKIHDAVILRVVRDTLERSRVLARLMELDQLKSKFVSTVSHEMRTPLAIVREFVSLVRDEVSGPVTSEQRDCLDTALRNCDRLTVLIEDLLELSQIESGKLKLRRVGIDLETVLRQCRHDFAPRCAAAGQHIDVRVEPGLPPVLGDRDKLLQVLVNLVGNAHKFNAAGVRITLEARADGKHVQVGVRDDGVGIAEEDQARVFQPFTQLDRRHKGGAQGTGLGLAISRSIVEHHGGSMGLESRSGAGSRFHFTVPLYRPGSELEAFVDDRRRTYQARGKSASLALVRVGREQPGPSAALETLRGVQRCAEGTWRRKRDETLLIDAWGLLACILESPPTGARVALARLRDRLNDDPEIAVDDLECAVVALTEVAPEVTTGRLTSTPFEPLPAAATHPEPPTSTEILTP